MNEFEKGEQLYIYTRLGLQEIFFDDFDNRDDHINCTYGKYKKNIRVKKTDVSKDPELAKLYYYKAERKEAFNKISDAKKRLEYAQNYLEKLYNQFKDLEQKFPEEFI